MSVLLHNARIFDGHSAEFIEDGWVAIEGDRIREVGQGEARFAAARSIDLRGRTLMPGLIDAHNHIWLADTDVDRLMRQRTEYISSFAVTALQQTLRRGFTTLRDAGGTDVGYALAVERGLLQGPRLYHAGRMLSQTGGHGDFRNPHEYGCGCAYHKGQDRFVALVDGADQVRHAVREELRKGAHQIKIMGSGGVASPADPLDQVQFTDLEIRTAVEEAAAHGTYVMAHCHPAEAIARCARLGVRSIEHGSLIDEAAADEVIRAGAFVVPTLIIVHSLYQEGAQLGMPAASIDKLKRIYEGGLMSGIEMMYRKGVKMGFGTDLMAQNQTRQNEEFILRRDVLPAIEILRQVTSVNADLMNLSGQIGCVQPGALADLIVVDGDPLEDISLLARPNQSLNLILKGGTPVVDQLG